MCIHMLQSILLFFFFFFFWVTGNCPPSATWQRYRTNLVWKMSTLCQLTPTKIPDKLKKCEHQPSQDDKAISPLLSFFFFLFDLHRNCPPSANWQRYRTNLPRYLCRAKIKVNEPSLRQSSGSETTCPSDQSIARKPQTGTEAGHVMMLSFFFFFFFFWVTGNCPPSATWQRYRTNLVWKMSTLCQLTPTKIPDKLKKCEHRPSQDDKAISPQL